MLLKLAFAHGAGKRASRVLDTGVTTLITALVCIPYWAFLHVIEKTLQYPSAFTVTFVVF